MRLISITLLFIMAISCSSKQQLKDEELAVIATVYLKIPMILPPPPPPSQYGIEEENVIDYSILEPIIFKYAINENFVDYDLDYVNVVSDKFEVYKSKYQFDEKFLDSSYMRLVNGLSKFKKIEKIDISKLQLLIKDNLVFWDGQVITKNEKDENDISGVISFSKVSFNDDFSKAVIVVGDYYEHLGNGVGLYILEKIDNRWVIKYTKTLMKS